VHRSGTAGRTVARRSAAVVALTLTIASLGSSAATARQRPTRVCNGSAKLCHRRLDHVAFATSHNAMASSAYGFQGPEQGLSIADQLERGVRGLMLDVYTGTPTTGHICTDPTPLKVARIKRESGQAFVDQLLAIRNAQCPPAGGPTAALYLCHSFCEVGATPFDQRLQQIKGFLQHNPNDVVVLMLEDYSPAADIMRSFRTAGLEKKMVRHEPGDPWPTLGDLVKHGKQLVVFAQHQGGDAPGLLDQYTEMNETPYSFASSAQFTCAANRGPRKARLFLVNHWVDLPDELAAAQEANAYPLLDARVKQCMQERGHLANFVAVNYADQGDLLRVVDELNGIPR
jgi:hypothetical protein